MERAKSQVPEKLYYKAAEVCELTDTQPYVLRFWESEFPQLASEKNRSGQRVYRRQDIDLIHRIKQLLYEQEYTIAGARKAIDGDVETVVAPPPPARGKGRKGAAASDSEPAASSVRGAGATRTSLFDGGELPEPNAALDEPRDRALHENALRTIDELRRELTAAIDENARARERNQRIADRLQAVLDDGSPPSA